MREEWNALLDGEPYDPIVRVEDDGTGGIWVEPAEGFPPPSLSLELGEMLYQLRAALDSCVYEAAIFETGENPPPDEEKLEFPFASTSEQFKQASRHIRPLSQELRAWIEAVQPYNAEAKWPPDFRYVPETLGLIHDLARKDRHRQLQVLGSWVVSTNPQLRVPEGVEVLWLPPPAGERGFLEDESQIGAFKLIGWEPDMPPVEANPDIYIDIAIHDAPPPRDDEDTLAWRMKLMFEVVTKTIRAFETISGFQPKRRRNRGNVHLWTPRSSAR